MLKLIEFLKNLFCKKKKMFRVEELSFMCSRTDKDGVEHIVHGNNEAKLTIQIKKGDGEGNCVIRADKNIIMDNESLVWLMKRYL